MKTLFEVCKPRNDILKGTIRESDFAADLAQVINGKAPDEYQKADLFFANTHPTVGLKELLKNVCQRLSGQGLAISSVFRLDTQYGGGKTHGLIALIHAANGMQGVTNIEEFINPSIVPKTPVRIAAFDGENADPVNGRPLGNGLRAYTPWGEIAYALAGVEGYEKVRNSDLERVAPGSDTIRELFGEEPALILLDELSIYIRKIRGRIEESQLTPFLTGLFKAVTSSDKACVVFTLAIGKEGKATDAYSQENEFIAEKLEEAIKVAGRVSTVLNPTTEQETVQVLRRRLFAEIDQQQAQEILAAYEQLWISQANELPTGRVGNERIENFRHGFPFHPALMDLLTEKLSTLSNFQRVRGMLRLLTKTVAHLWQQQPTNTYAIHVHHMDPGHAPIRDEVVTRLEYGRFDPAIQNDVSAPNGSEPALAQQLDSQYYAGIAPYASFVARSILWHTLAFNENLQGIDQANLRYSILGPSLEIGFINDARGKFVTESAYLDDRPMVPLRFLSEVNLNVLIRRQTKQVDRQEARSQLDDRIRTTFSGKDFNLKLFASAGYDVPDEVEDERPILVLINYDAATVKSDLLTIPDLVENIYSYRGSQDNYRHLKNNLVFLVADDATCNDMKSKIANRLALDAMRRPDRLNQLPLHQQDKVNELYRTSEQQVTIAIQQCYRHLFYPSLIPLEGATTNLAHTAFDIPSTSDEPGKGQLQVMRALTDNNKLLRDDSAPPGPNYVRDNTPLKKGEMSTGDLRLEFRKDPRFPIMLGNENFISLINKGVREGIFVYKRGDLVYGQGDPPASIAIDQQSFVLTAAYAKERNIFPRPIPETEESISTSVYGLEDEGKKLSVKDELNPYNPLTVTTPTLPSVKVLKAEAPLREALTKIWEDARGSKIDKLASLSLRVFDYNDAFKLIKAITQVSNSQKQVTLNAEYETSEHSRFQMEFSGQPADVEPIKEFLSSQFRAALEKTLETTLLLTYPNGLDLNSQDPENITEKLTRFATGAVFVEAIAEGQKN